MGVLGSKIHTNNCFMGSCCNGLVQGPPICTKLGSPQTYGPSAKFINHETLFKMHLISIFHPFTLP
jgi:hypothetical protein